MRRVLRIGSVAAALCACLAACLGPSKSGGNLVWHTGDAWTRVAELEDARTTGDGELVKLFASEDAALRARVATALGRMPFPDEGAEVTRALLEALFDPDAGVRAAAAFGLGMRGDPSAADKLLFVALDYHEADKDAVVRARALEAASKLDRPELRERMLDGLFDSDARVRLEAAEGASRWPLTDPNATAVNQRLVDSLANEKARDVIVYTLFALERRKAKEAVDQFIAFARSEDSEQRLFATRGLKALAPDPRAWDALQEIAQGKPFGTAIPFALPRDEWRAQCEAVLGLGAFRTDEAFAVLSFAWGDNAHMRRCVGDAMGAHLSQDEDKGAGEECVAAIADGAGDFAHSPYFNDESASVRASWWEALVPGLAIRAKRRKPDDPSEVRALLVTLNSQWPSQPGAPIVGAGFARGLARVESSAAVDMLILLGARGDLVVRGAAIEALAKHDTPQTREFLQAMLADPDNGIRLAAVTALGEMMPNTSDVEPLKRCYDSSTGDGAVEIRFNVLRNVAKIGGDPAMAILVAAFADPNAFVRKVARDELQRAFPDMKVTKLDVRVPDAHPAAVPVAGRDFQLYEKNPIVDVVTSRGTMTFELFPQEAPVHVFNFLKQIEAKHYDGLDFHRVVPDFVIQGGDYRGDGNGGGTWRGPADALRHEVTPRKYVRGSLGMPRNEDFESGGSQFFVTHRPTPHLDGRYTIFGELRDGFEVLDSIEVGDKILSVRVRK